MTRKEIFTRTIAVAGLLYDSHEAAAIADRLCSDLFGFGRFEVAMDGDIEPQEFDNTLFDNVLERLSSGEPVQYIVGHTEFFGRCFKVCSGVLIPRPETEELVAWVLEECGATEGCRVLDIGTGSGAIAISLAAERRDWSVDALELSPVAADVAEANAKANDVRVNVLRGDVFEFSPASESYDVIISNPPYIPLPEREDMEPNVRDFEPHEALFVPIERPLLFYERIADVAQVALRSGGWLCFEIHSPLADHTAQMLREKGFSSLMLRSDINSKPRMIICRKS
ncbi:MAG: peptide chain release factor N(5)-glutamine methyltransferase [Tidjanibacter sp.]|nr:peptide chain release factor N(5)-glutamine methyltransferase [Tidjanibacter sp.]